VLLRALGPILAEWSGSAREDRLAHDLDVGR
jgi:hypothetical protein